MPKNTTKEDTDARAIWIATYAAAFSDAFFEARVNGHGFDAAVAGNAELATAIADQAVAQLREWRTNGQHPPSRQLVPSLAKGRKRSATGSSRGR